MAGENSQEVTTELRAEKEPVIPGRRETKHTGPDTGESMAFSRNKEMTLLGVY